MKESDEVIQVANKNYVLKKENFKNWMGILVISFFLKVSS